MKIADIKSGERDRFDLGDISGLAQSIKSVGMLHPVVITADGQLVAGDRRIAAAKSLGWTEVPVTVVDLDSAGAVLRAEADENECRKALSPVEASKARERRAKVLAEDARSRQVEAGRTAGRGQIASPKLGGPTESRTAKVGAVGTGYSGSTLDKVDKIRKAAEHGTATVHGKEIELPPAVQEKAAEVVTMMHERRRNPSRAEADLNEQIKAVALLRDSEILMHEHRRIVSKGLAACHALINLDAELMGASADHELVESVNRTAESVAKWAARYQSAMPKLRKVT